MNIEQFTNLLASEFTIYPYAGAKGILIQCDRCGDEKPFPCDSVTSDVTLETLIDWSKKHWTCG